MYHHDSAGSISYAEFRHLGKEGVLGRYSITSIWPATRCAAARSSAPRSGTAATAGSPSTAPNYLVVRDCVGYQSVGHGFFLEDGTEVYNVLDHNLAVQAYIGKPLPKQVLPYDKNDGSGFWWANSLNTFTRNVAAECDEYGYLFQATEDAPTSTRCSKSSSPTATPKQVDIRTLPFVRFEDNESTASGGTRSTWAAAPFGAAERRRRRPRSRPSVHRPRHASGTSTGASTRSRRRS